MDCQQCRLRGGNMDPCERCYNKKDLKKIDILKNKIRILWSYFTNKF
jgi:hypothetical protein